MANSRRERNKKVKSVLFCSALCACAIIASVIYGFKDMVEDFGETIFTDLAVYNIALRATLLSVDPKVGSLTVNWEVEQIGRSFVIDSNGIKIYNMSGDYTSVNIYFDENTLFQSDGSTKYFTNEKPALPVFQLTPALWDTQYANSASFQTRINLFPKSGSTSLRSYPFDTYTSEMRLFAEDSATNASVTLFVNGIVGIPGFRAQVAFQKILTREEQFTIHETMTISRGNATKAYAIIFILSVWVVTLIFLFTTSMSVICGYPQRVEFLGIPLATFFTVAQVRPTMPGSPEFDNIGLIPCLSLMAACSALNLGVLFMSDATKERASLGETFDWIPLGLYSIIAGLCTRLRVMILGRGRG